MQLRRKKKKTKTQGSRVAQWSDSQGCGIKPVWEALGSTPKGESAWDSFLPLHLYHSTLGLNTKTSLPSNPTPQVIFLPFLPSCLLPRNSYLSFPLSLHPNSISWPNWTAITKYCTLGRLKTTENYFSWYWTLEVWVQGTAWSDEKPPLVRPPTSPVLMRWKKQRPLIYGRQSHLWVLYTLITYSRLKSPTF